MIWATTIFFSIVTATVVYLLLMSIYQLVLLVIYRATRGPDPRPGEKFDESQLPTVTVQLPVYNEGPLARQCLSLAAELDWPADKLQIQYLDDSDDEITTQVARETIEELQRERPNLQIQILKRGGRTGFKAGALKYGTERATGEFLAIFDADFLIPRDFLRKTMHYFTDPAIGIVQARWDYTNHEVSLFCRLQANKLDIHQMAEQTARARVGLQAIFHGTAGIWRASTLAAAGGWDCLSEVEDVELTIRAANAGHTMIYLDHLRIASELPETMIGYIRQQMRWKRGWIRLARHYSRMILAGEASWLSKLDLLQRIHMCWGSACALVMTLAVLPYFMAANTLKLTGPAIGLYVISLLISLLTRVLEERTLKQDPMARPAMRMPRLLRWLPFGYLMNLGMVWPLTQATFEGFRPGQIWEVTPKSGTTAGSVGHHGETGRKKLPMYAIGTLIVGGLGGLLGVASLALGHPLAAFFYAILVVGCGWIGFAVVHELRPGWFDSGKTENTGGESRA